MKIIIFLLILFIFINLKNQNDYFSTDNYQEQLIKKQPIKKFKYKLNGATESANVIKKIHNG